MTVRKIINGDLRAYINWEGRWRHVYIFASYDQMTLLGDPVRMLEFKLSKRSRIAYTSEKINFHKTKPAARKKGAIVA